MAERQPKLNGQITNSAVIAVTGAGASAPLGLRTTYSFRELIEHEDWFLDGRPSFYATLSSLDATDNIDVERVLDFMHECLEHYEALCRDPEFDSFFSAPGNPAEKFRERREKVLDMMVAHYANVDAVRASQIYGAFFDMLRTTYSVRTLPIFTLNYDIAVEKAVETLPKTKLVDGVDTRLHEATWNPGVFQSYRAPTGKSGRLAVVLFKLHGSVSWVQREGSQAIIRLPGVPRRTPNLRHVLQHPSAKYKELGQEPYATGYRYLARCLRTAKVVLVVGCSFRDEELITELKNGLAENPKLQICAVNRSKETIENARSRGIPIQTGLAADFGSKSCIQLVEILLRHYQKTGEPWPEQFIDQRALTFQ